MLRRLCPVPSVRNAAAAGASGTLGLSDALAAGTRDVHDASDALIRSKAPLAFSDPAVWAALLSQFWHVFQQLEAALAQAAATDARIAALHAPLFSRLARADAFLADVAFHSGGKPPAPQLAPTKEYSARLAAVAKSDPLLLVAYAQTMYVALLAGGQTLARMLRATRALPPGVEGTVIFDFEATVPAAEQRRFRAALKEAVDALGEKLTATERAALLTEKRAIFTRNDRIISAVLAAAEGSVWRAWLRILLSLLMLPRVYALHAARRARMLALQAARRARIGARQHALQLQLAALALGLAGAALISQQQ